MSIANYDEREAKLPKWAQDQFRVLRNRLDDVENTLKIERDTGIEDCEPHIGVSMDVFGSVKRYPADSRITFQTGTYHSDKFELYVRDGVLEIFGGTSFKIKPRAANSIQLKLER